MIRVGRGFSKSLTEEVVVEQSSQGFSFSASSQRYPSKNIFNNYGYVRSYQCSSFFLKKPLCSVLHAQQNFHVRTTSHYYYSAITMRKCPTGRVPCNTLVSEYTVRSVTTTLASI